MATRSTVRRLLRRRADRLSERAWGRLQAGLVAGDPCGEVTAAWTIAQDLMRCYQLRDPAPPAAVITAARDCPIPEIARLGRTLHTWRAEFLAHFAHPTCPTGRLNPELEDQEHQAHRARIPQLRQLPAPPTSQPRPNPEQSPDITDPNPPSQLGGVEPDNQRAAMVCRSRWAWKCFTPASCARWPNVWWRMGLITDGLTWGLARSPVILMLVCGREVSAGLPSFSCLFGSGLVAEVRRGRPAVAGVVRWCCATGEAMRLPRASGWAGAERVVVGDGPGGREC